MPPCHISRSTMTQMAGKSTAQIPAILPGVPLFLGATRIALQMRLKSGFSDLKDLLHTAVGHYRPALVCGYRLVLFLDDTR
jgi:hypothetical protein